MNVLRGRERRKARARRPHGPSSSLSGPDKIADKPHWITIGLGLLSPMISSIAIVVALLAFEASRGAARVANRADLVIRDSMIRHDVYREQGNAVVVIDTHQFDILNRGKAPVEVIRMVASRRLVAGWIPGKDAQRQVSGNIYRHEFPWRGQLDAVSG
jgi:hypothetical protein